LSLLIRRPFPVPRLDEPGGFLGRNLSQVVRAPFSYAARLCNVLFRVRRQGLTKGILCGSQLLPLSLTHALSTSRIIPVFPPLPPLLRWLAPSPHAIQLNRSSPSLIMTVASFPIVLDRGSIPPRRCIDERPNSILPSGTIKLSYDSDTAPSFLFFFTENRNCHHPSIICLTPIDRLVPPTATHGSAPTKRDAFVQTSYI